MERRASELDTTELPESDRILDWRHFTSDFTSSQLDRAEVMKIVNENRDRRIDLRPYMILSPFVCCTTDSVQKVLDIYRYM